MEFESFWQNTRTYFSLLRERILSLPYNENFSVCIVGSADGKFVFPLARQVRKIYAVEMDCTMVNGGAVILPDGTTYYFDGLRKSISKLNLTNKVSIVEGDWQKVLLPEKVDIIFSSCAWHYSKNTDWGVSGFIEKMKECVSEGGLFCSEYMMPSALIHEQNDLYLREGEINRYFPKESWEILDSFYTDIFQESAHVGNLYDHQHKMGFILAKKRNNHG
jgi:hypothetical protein